MEPIFHITTGSEWIAAQRVGAYEGDTLASEGFVHCSFAQQVSAVANSNFRGRSDLIVLQIDPALLDVQVRVEDLHGGGENFPHVYGPIRVEAIAGVHELSPGDDGSFSFP